MEIGRHGRPELDRGHVAHASAHSLFLFSADADRGNGSEGKESRSRSNGRVLGPTAYLCQHSQYSVPSTRSRCWTVLFYTAISTVHRCVRRFREE